MTGGGSEGGWVLELFPEMMIVTGKMTRLERG